MIKGVTDNGFAFAIDEDALDDAEFLEILVAITKGDRTALPDFVLGFFGAEQKQRLYDFCRDESGRVRLSRVELEIKGVFEAIQNPPEETPVKN